MRFQPDPRFTFDTFVAGPGNQMAAAAARRAAEAPGTSYNPLFVYGAAGVGKSHLLHAVGALSLTVRPDLHVTYRTAQELVDDISSAVSAGTLEAFADELLESDVILIDDAHLLAGKSRTQAELLRVWDEIVWTGTQIVLAAEAAPADLEGVTEEFRGKLAGGLVVDMTPAEPETRVEIVRRAAARRGVELGGGVGEALAGLPLDGARELHAGVDRIGQVQEEERRQVRVSELSSLVGLPRAEHADEFSAFLFDITSTVEQIVETDPWRKKLAEAILRWEGEGFRTRRLEHSLDTDSAFDVDALLAGYAADVEKLRTIAAALAELDSEAAGSAVLKDPDRVAEAEALLLSARAAAERSRPAPPPVDRWYLNNPEKVAWDWLALDDRLIEELA
ncbi:DnaA ATPase domain-containing protein [Longimicrobium sp.]|uniref:DnaA/Hda family protein n=1 Tax=Longimicrobium sp. TaxID=2029185 RepID=UPI002C1807AC|nr:DnaA/Hda family protein [Longimicrobium sp.]HSU17915.1 DnaA/Hda family protein [Longimicrobium sp.]